MKKNLYKEIRNNIDIIKITNKLNMHYGNYMTMVMNEKDMEIINKEIYKQCKIFVERYKKEYERNS